MKGLLKMKGKILSLALALAMLVSVFAGGNMLEVKAETSRTTIESVTLKFDWTKFEVSESLGDSSEPYEFWVTMTGTGVTQTDDPYRYLLVKPTQAHVDAGYISADVLNNAGSDSWVSIWQYSEEYEIGATDVIGYSLRLQAEDGYAFSETTNVQVKDDYVGLERAIIEDNPNYDDGNCGYLVLTLRLGTGADIEEAINPSTQEPVTPPTTAEEYVFDIYEYGEDCVFKYYFSEYNEETGEYEWEELDSGGFGTTLYAGQPIGTQIANSLKIEEEPTRAGATFEGWAKFKVDHESGEHTFVPQSATKQYYTTEEMLASEMPNYDVKFVPKWSDISVDEYFPMNYSFVLNANGGKVALSYTWADYIEKFEVEVNSFGTTEFKSLRESLKESVVEITGINKTGEVLENWSVYQAESIDAIWVMKGETVEKSDANQMVIFYDTFEYEDGTAEDVYLVINGYKLIDNAMSTEKLFDSCKNNNYYAVANWKKSVTLVEDTEVKETLASEEKTVLEAIKNGTVKETVVSKETAENVKYALAEGKEVNAKLVVYPVDETLVNETEKTSILDEATKKLGKDAKVQYLDIQVVLMSEDKVLGNIDELQKEIEITISIPEDMKADNVKYVVIRNHDDKIDTLPVTVNADGTLTFKTDRFSTYALAYADETQSVTTAPETGDTSNIVVYAAMLCLAMYAVSTVLRKQRLEK